MTGLALVAGVLLGRPGFVDPGGPTGPTGPTGPGDVDFLQYPTVTGTTRTVSSMSTLITAAAASQPGDEIVCQPGTYAGGNVNFPNSSLSGDPIVIRPASGQSVTFTGSGNVFEWTNAKNVQVWGITMDTTGASNRMTRIQSGSGGMMFAYCSIKFVSSANWAIENAGMVGTTRFHRCRFYAAPDGAHTNTAFKLGGTGMAARTDLRVTLDWCYFQDLNWHREGAFQGKIPYTARDCHFVNCNGPMARSMFFGVFERLRIQNQYKFGIMLQGGGHIVRDIAITGAGSAQGPGIGVLAGARILNGAGGSEIGASESQFLLPDYSDHHDDNTFTGSKVYYNVHDSDIAHVTNDGRFEYGDDPENISAELIFDLPPIDVRYANVQRNGVVGAPNQIGLTPHYAPSITATSAVSSTGTPPTLNATVTGVAAYPVYAGAP